MTIPGATSCCKKWHAGRTDFWAEVLGKLDVQPGLARAVADYALMEEYYAYALHRECTYQLLLSETCRALSYCAFNRGAAGPVFSHVSLNLETQPLSIRETDDSSDAPIKEQLLKEAIRIIENAGLEALNQRRLAKNAGVSSSAIANFFKDMKTFRNRAIWRALVNGIPSQLDPEGYPVEQPSDLGQWMVTLDGLLEVGETDRLAGFYIGFARLTAQAACCRATITRCCPWLPICANSKAGVLTGSAGTSQRKRN